MNNREIQYDQPWLRSAIPFPKNKADKCFRYALKNYTQIRGDQCNGEMFDNSTKIACTEFVYASDEKNVQTEVRSMFFFHTFQMISLMH